MYARNDYEHLQNLRRRTPPKYIQDAVWPATVCPHGAWTRRDITGPIQANVSRAKQLLLNPGLTIRSICLGVVDMGIQGNLCLQAQRRSARSSQRLDSRALETRQTPLFAFLALNANLECCLPNYAAGVKPPARTHKSLALQL